MNTFPFKRCDSRGVLEVFASLKEIPALLIYQHPMGRGEESHGVRYVCEDSYGCVRRSRVWMAPGHGMRYGCEMP